MNACPKCNISWLSANTMPEDLLNKHPDYYLNIDQAWISALDYGWRVKNDKRFGVNSFYCKDWVDGVKVRYWLCDSCKSKFTLDGREVK